ncbi:alpha-amylase-like [Epinephelus lanceolatus]
MVLAQEDKVLQVLLDLMPVQQQDYVPLAGALERCFGQQTSTDSMRNQSFHWRHREGEILGAYVADFNRQRGYPTFDPAACEELALDAFIQGLTPEQRKEHLHIPAPITFNGALEEAERVEAVLRPQHPIRHQVIDLGGEPITSSEYFHLGRVSEFKYGAKLGTVFRKWNSKKLSYTKTWGEGWGFMPNGNALVFVDNHDNQRGHGAGGASIVTFWDSRLYKMAVGYMLAHPYGVARVMSSFRWNRNIVNGKDQNDWMGPPSHGDGSTKPVPINPDQTCGDGWVCEHRWRQIKSMVIFRNVVNGLPHSNWWDNQSNQVAFGRGNRGFIVFNNDDWNLDVTLNTGMPGGTYCDVISGQKEGSRCTGKQIHVGGDGRAHFKISNRDEDPFVAIHAESKL